MQETVLKQVMQQVGRVILGKDQPIRLALACLLARGHLLIEDRPGVGKTLLAHVLAKSLGLVFQRIQFTSDLLPSDLLGVSIFDRNLGKFVFHPGPLFSQVVLADEVNRASPKAQSALLESMEEYQITLEGESRPLPHPFFVIATQNPSHSMGTFPLPESQLDRFLMRISLGYPDSDSERILLQGEDRRHLLKRLKPCLDASGLLQIQKKVDQVEVSHAILDYVQALLTFSRTSPKIESGLSPRAGLALLACSKAYAFLMDHRGVLPEDVQAVLPGVVGHRLRMDGERVEDSGSYLLNKVPIP